MGSLIGGILYKTIGGAFTLRVFSSLAVLAAITYLLLYTLVLKDKMPNTKTDKKSNNQIVWKSPEMAARDCETASLEINNVT